MCPPSDIIAHKLGCRPSGLFLISVRYEEIPSSSVYAVKISSAGYTETRAVRNFKAGTLFFRTPYSAGKKLLQDHGNARFDRVRVRRLLLSLHASACRSALSQLRSRLCWRVTTSPRMAVFVSMEWILLVRSRLRMFLESSCRCLMKTQGTTLYLHHSLRFCEKRSLSVRNTIAKSLACGEVISRFDPLT